MSGLAGSWKKSETDFPEFTTLLAILPQLAAQKTRTLGRMTNRTTGAYGVRFAHHRLGRADTAIPMQDVRHFFERVLPQRLAAQDAVSGWARGKIAFVIDGAGTWTVELGPSPAVSEDAGFDADLTLIFSLWAFRSFTGGRVPGQGFVATGDRKLLRRLAAVLDEPAASVVALRSEAG